jgi:uncharacterized protein (DUF697 family)
MRFMSEERAALPWQRILRGELDEANAADKAKAIRDLIRWSSSRSAVIAMEPLLLVDAAIYTPIQHKMVRSIARLRGYSLDRKGVRAALALMRPRVFRWNMAIAATKLIPIVPFLPGLWSGAMTYALTTTIGELSDRYFRGGRAMPAEEIRSSFDAIFKETYEQARRTKKNELRAMFRSKDVRREIRAIKHTYNEGKIGAEEALARTDAILAESDRREVARSSARPPAEPAPGSGEPAPGSGRAG